MSTSDETHSPKSIERHARSESSGYEQAPTEIELLEIYRGEIDIRLERLPALQPRVLPTRSNSRLRRFVDAGRRRSFTLIRNFEINIAGPAVPGSLQGTIVIPRSAADSTNVFDGASIPFPVWRYLQR